MDRVELLKQQAGIEACKYVTNGMKVGLGTGSTVKYTVIELGRRIAEEGLEIVRKANRKDLEKELIDYLDEIHR